MKPIAWHIKDEWQPLEAVMIGIGEGMGGVPTLEETYDPQSRHHVLQGSYPSEASVTRELNELVELLEAHHVQVIRPDFLGINQVFTRDIGFVIDDTFILTHMVEDRALEQKGLDSMFARNPLQVIQPPANVQMEGGDIMPMRDEIWVGYAKDHAFAEYTTARTNEAALNWLQKSFPKRKVRPFELKKSETDPFQNALHLDCCVAPLGMGHLIFHPEGLINEQERHALMQMYPETHRLEVTAAEMQAMHCNVLSLAPNVVISGKGFERTNAQMRDWGYQVLEANLTETAKMGGLLRCASLPLRRTPKA
jgi:N-dimethylarginine dimethylaminohydrolase